MTNADLIDDITGLIDDNDFADAIDLIVRRAGELDEKAGAAIMAAAKIADPTFSGVGAEIRDALRNNTDLTLTPAKPARKTPVRKAPAKKATAPVKKEFAPKVTDKGRLDHSDCGHERTMKGRSACRAEFAKSAK
jgi:hypothetical protein